MHRAQIVTFAAGTEIVAGIGASCALGPTLERLTAVRPVLVTDEGVKRSGLVERILSAAAPHRPVVLDPVKADPAPDQLERLSHDAAAQDPDVIVALGGGSALVAGKAVALTLANGGEVTQYEGRDKAPKPPLPVIAIPTTAGSGSEVSNALVVRDPRKPAVTVVRGRGYEPAVAILDGRLLRSLPERPLLYAALDALSHAVEALWANGASRFTDALASAALALIHRSLPRALESRDDTSLQCLLEASAMANLACGSSGLALVHALSLSTDVTLAHGYQNGVLLPWVADFNRPAVRPWVRDEIDRLRPLYRRIGFEPRFAADEINGCAAEAMVRVALASPLSGNNVRSSGAGELRSLLEPAGVAVGLPEA